MSDDFRPPHVGDAIPAVDILAELEQLVHPHTIALAAQRVASRRLAERVAALDVECHALQTALAESASPDEQGDHG